MRTRERRRYTVKRPDAPVCEDCRGTGARHHWVKRNSTDKYAIRIRVVPWVYCKACLGTGYREAA